MNLIEVFILSLFDFTMLLLLYTTVFVNLELSLMKKGLIVLLGSVLVASISTLVPEEFVASLLSQVLVFIFFMKAFKFKFDFIPSFTTAFIIVTVAVSLVQFSVIMGATILFGTVEQIFVYGFVFQSIGVFLVLLIKKYIPLSTLFDYIDNKNVWAQIVSFNLLIVLIGLTVFWYISPDDLLDAVMSMMIIFLLAIIITNKLLKDGLIDKQQKEKLYIYETYLPIINSVVDKMRITQHDYNNQVQIMNELKKNTQLTKDVYDYLNEVVMPTDESKLIFFDNKIIMALLYSKFNEAESKGIELTVDIKNFHFESQYTDYELVEMYGILLTNAIEALQDENEKKMHVKLAWKDQQNVFVVSNYVDHFQASSADEMFSANVSTKGAGRGIGLYKLNKMLSKHNGQINVIYDEISRMLKIEINHN